MSKKRIIGTSALFLVAIGGSALVTYGVASSCTQKVDNSFNFSLKKDGENKISILIKGANLSDKLEDYVFLIDNKPVTLTNSKIEKTENQNEYNITFDYDQQYVGQKIKIKFKDLTVVSENTYPSYADLQNASISPIVENHKDAMIKITLGGKFLEENNGQNYEVFVNDTKQEIKKMVKNNTTKNETINLYISYNSGLVDGNIKIKCVETNKEVTASEAYPKIPAIKNIESLNQSNELVEITLNGMFLDLLSDASKFEIKFNDENEAQKDWTIKTQSDSQIVLSKKIDANKISTRISIQYEETNLIYESDLSTNYLTSIDVTFLETEIKKIIDSVLSATNDTIPVESQDDFDNSYCSPMIRDLNSELSKYGFANVDIKYDIENSTTTNIKNIKNIKIVFLNNISGNNLTNFDIVDNKMIYKQVFSTLININEKPNGELKFNESFINAINQIITNNPFGSNYDLWKNKSKSMIEHGMG